MTYHRDAKIYQIANTEFAISDPSGSLTTYFEAFVETYATPIDLPPSDRVDVRVVVTDADSMHERTGKFSSEATFHRSPNYAHWNVVGVGDGRSVFLSEYGFLAQCHEAGRIEIAVTEPCHPRVPELIFHTARNVAWYSRAADFGPAVHASAVEIAGTALLFAGAKGAGKSTLFIDAVTHLNALPIANDRVIVHQGSVAVSWPCYISYCEGTIADYPLLRAAFLDYEDAVQDSKDDYGTLLGPGWGRSLRQQYDQEYKRIIPPNYFVGQLGKRYRAHAPIGALVVPTAAPHSGESTITRERTCADLTDQELDHLLFDAVDTDIAAWHGLVGPARQVQAEQVRAAKFPVYDLLYDPISGKESARSVLVTLASAGVRER